MGLFSFITDAGAKIFGDDDETRAKKLTEEVLESGLSIEDLKIEIEDEKATVYGMAEDQPVREKVILMVGNKNGISEVDDQMTVKVVEKPVEEQPKVEEEVAPEPEPEPQFYTVKKGDTLGKIAKEFYGNAMKYPEIFEANKPMLKNPDLIYPGQTLRIPVLE